MIRLSMSSLRRDLRAVLATFVVMVASAVLVSFAVHFLWSAVTPAGALAIATAPKGTPGALLALSIFLIVLGLGVPIVVCVSLVSSLAVRESQTVYASWRLAGASPVQVKRVVRFRSLLTAVLASATGYVLSLPLLQGATTFLVSSTDIEVDLRIELGIVPFAGLSVVLCTLAFFGSLRPSVHASMVKPIVLFSERIDSRRHSVTRWVLAGLFGMAAVGLGVAALGTDRTGSRAMQGIFAGFALAGLIAIAAPLLLPPLIRLWTMVAPEAGFPTWFLARRYVLAKRGSTAAAVVPLTVAASMIGVYFSILATWEALQGKPLAGGAENITQGLILFGPGAGLALLAATCNLFTSGRGRERYEETLHAVGLSPSGSRAAAVWEASIYAGTAFIISVVVSTFSSLLIGIPPAVAGDEWHLSIDLVAILITVAIGFIPLCLATVLPARAASRGDHGGGSVAHF